MKLFITLFLLATGIAFAQNVSSLPENRAKTPVLPESPSDEQIQHSGVFLETLIPTDGAEGGNAELAAAVNAFTQRELPDDLSILEAYVRDNPRSRWKDAVSLNLAILTYKYGYFSEALKIWKRIWLENKEAKEGFQKGLADRAIAEYARMLARIGRMDELQELVTETQDRSFNNEERQRLNSALQGLWRMTKKPGLAFMCGPYALRSVAKSGNPEMVEQDFLSNIRSTPRGFSMEELVKFGRARGVELRAVRTKAGEEVPTPSIVHWKVGHFAAILGKEGDFYLVEDPTFGGGSMRISQRVLERESSGIVLTSARGFEPEPGENAVSEAELSGIIGKGHSGDTDEDETDCPEDCDCGMAGYSFHKLLCSLSVADMPLPTTTWGGPDINYTVRYNQREARQYTATPSFSNFGKSWVSGFISYLEEAEPNVEGSTINVRKLGGGGDHIEGTTYDPLTKTYGREFETHGKLKRLVSGATHIGYELEFPNGTKHVYTHETASLFFLKKIINRAGSEIEFIYENELPGGGLAGRLKRIQIASNLYAEFSYPTSGDMYKITKITDPWGRSADFGYTSEKLTSITDPVGIVSEFHYDGTGFLDRLTTPYGVTTFNTGHPGDPQNPVPGGALIAWIEATDPMGATERVEMNLNAEETGLPLSYGGPTPEGMLPPGADFSDQVCFYWNRKQWEEAKGLSGWDKYGKAHIMHWLSPMLTTDKSTGVLEWEKKPLEGYVFYKYQGQPAAYVIGSEPQPSKIGRILDDGSTQLTERIYNFEGSMTYEYDPLRRATMYEYFPNGVDVYRIRKSFMESWVTVQEYGDYHASGQPGWVKDEGRFQTFYTYTSDGLLETVTNPLNEVTSYVYGTSASSPNYRKLIEVKKRPTIAGTDVTVWTINREIETAGGRVIFKETTTDADNLPVVRRYDELMRLIKTTYADASTEEILYNRLDAGWVKDRNGRWTTNFYNANRQMTASRSPEGDWTIQEWCTCGSLSAIIDGNGNKTEWIRDLQSRVTKKIFPDLTDIDYVYEANISRLHSITDAEGQVKTYEYFKDDRLKKISYTNENIATPDVQYTYDDLGRQDTRTDGSDVTDFIYYPIMASQLGAGKLKDVDGPWMNDTITYSYDATGRMNGKTINSTSQSWSYDYLGRQGAVANALGTFTPTYIGNGGRLDALAYPNGMIADYSYYSSSGNLRLQTLQYRKSGGDQISKFSYGYDAADNITDWTQERENSTAGWDWDYRYDGNDQLKIADKVGLGVGYTDLNENYHYDASGNRISRQSGSTIRRETPNELNQLVSTGGGGAFRVRGTLNEAASVKINGKYARMLSNTSFEGEVDLNVGTTTFNVTAKDGAGNIRNQNYQLTVSSGTSSSFSYDLNGNLTSDGTKTYEWDAENRLVGINYPGTGQKTSISYDGLGKRTKIVEAGSTTEEKRFLWCEMELCEVEEENSSGVTKKRFFDMGMQVVTSSGTTKYFYTKDHLGSIREVLDLSQNLQKRYEYDVFGQITYVSGGVESDFRFTGHYWHGRSGLHLAPFRAYAADLSKWISRDPLGELALSFIEKRYRPRTLANFSAELIEGPNLYAYVGNNPVGEMDVSGLGARRTPAPPKKYTTICQGVSASTGIPRFGMEYHTDKCPDRSSDKCCEGAVNSYNYFVSVTRSTRVAYFAALVDYQACMSGQGF